MQNLIQLLGNWKNVNFLKMFFVFLIFIFVRECEWGERNRGEGEERGERERDRQTEAGSMLSRELVAGVNLIIL